MKTISVQCENHIAYLHFNRPDAMNCYNDVMARELAEAIESIAHDDEIRVCVLRGAGPCFMAGGDIEFFSQQDASLSKDVESLIVYLESAIQNLITMPKPVIACAHGSVAGVGMSFLAASDLVLATDDCVFTMAYSKLGVTPDGGATYLLPRILGHKKAMEWMLLSERLSAKQVHEAGFINWVVGQDAFESSIQKRAKQLATGPSQAYGNLKHLMHSSLENNFAQQLQAEANSFVQCTQTDDFKRAIKAFLAG